VDSQLAVYVCEVIPRSSGRDAEPHRYLLIGEAPRRQCKHLAFTSTEPSCQPSLYEIVTIRVASLIGTANQDDRIIGKVKRAAGDVVRPRLFQSAGEVIPRCQVTGSTLRCPPLLRTT